VYINKVACESVDSTLTALTLNELDTVADNDECYLSFMSRNEPKTLSRELEKKLTVSHTLIIRRVTLSPFLSKDG
jgi:hypothetical protein